MAVDALEALVKLQADMSGWLEKAEALRCTAHSRYNEFTKMPDALAAPPPPKKRGGSMESLRPEDDGEPRPSADDSPPPESNTLHLPLSLQAVQSTIPTTVPVAGKINIDPRNRHLFREVREQRRKRKDPSLKDGHSGPQKLRRRSKIVIYYDSGIQNGFHTLVQSISGARNVLRKARHSVSPRPQLLSTKEEQSPWGRQGSYGYAMPGSSRLGLPLGNNPDGKNPWEVYAQLDRELESAQTLCEVGAHQALRDGDCFEELEEVKTHFERCLKSIDGEIVNFKQHDEALHAAHNGMDGEHVLLDHHHQTSRKASVFESSDPSEIAVDGLIEVDQEDAASIVIDLSELPGRHQYSSKFYSNGHESPSEASKDTQPSNSHTNASQKVSAPVNSPKKEDLLTKYTASGMDVPIDQAQALAAFITVDNDDPSLDLDALRNSVPRRHQEQSPSPVAALEDIAPEPEFDMVAMRETALKRRGPPAVAASDTVPAATAVEKITQEPEFDMAAMKKAALAKRREPRSASDAVPIAANGRYKTNGAEAPAATLAKQDSSAVLKAQPTSDTSAPMPAPDAGPEFDFAAMKKSALKKRHAPDPPSTGVASYINNGTPASRHPFSALMADPALSDHRVQIDAKQSVMVDSTHDLSNSPRAQLA